MRRSHERTFLVLAATLLLQLPGAGCLPLTFSHEGVIDFDVYSSVYVRPIGGLSSTFHNYLVEELRRESGFERVTTDENEAVDLVLTVSVEVDRVWDDDDDSYEYEVTASFVARTSAGAGVEVDSGRITDSSDFRDEAIEDALDEIALHYLRAYRI